ncbi:reverse transcriptase domain-containing protein [Tanacetum coccineum]
MSAYPNPGSTGLFADPTGCLTLFVRWIEDYPLPDGLKMPSHVGSYDGKGDPDNYLHLFEGAIRLHEDQIISRFVHGLRTRNLVEFLSTDLPTTYKGLMEKTYTWIEAREVATNGASSDQREGPDRNPAACKEVEELMKAGFLRKVKNQTWVANPVMVKKSDGGIRANPLKVKAVTDLEPPRTLKDVQSLNEKLAALSRFLSKGAKKSLPFFKMLKSYTDKRTVQWTMDAKEAFQKIKKFMEIVPTLIAPIKDEVLVMYLAALAESIIDVLLVERKERQVPIYFVSRVLHGAELNYLALEKLILALVHAAKVFSSTPDNGPN